MSAAGPSRRGSGLGPILALVILIAASLGVLKHLDRRAAGGADLPGGRRAGAERRLPAGQAAREGGSGGSPADRETGDWMPADDAIHRVAIVIDDVGFEEGPALDLAKAGLPLTFAVLPFQRYSQNLASRVKALGHEVILHLPMEPLAYPIRDPGQGAVGEGMSPATISEAVRRDLDAVPGAVGVNNHMGSRATADSRIMRAVLEVVRQRGLYFLDSRTSTSTVGFDLARRMGVRAVERSVFLDDRREASYIEGQVRELLRRAREEGSAVGIGHADPVTVGALKRSSGLLRSADIRLVPASELAEDSRGSN
ncbi:MAG TPA: divergent polysaccharide deacetylase family protein [Candidatus Polarisedimenticolia bacterium]|nr:divergent polysaccharide deacetylase family protein [Candidatus Polarisedimenticolia bacterium]